MFGSVNLQMSIILLYIYHICKYYSNGYIDLILFDYVYVINVTASFLQFYLDTKRHYITPTSTDTMYFFLSIVLRISLYIYHHHKQELKKDDKTNKQTKTKAKTKQNKCMLNVRCIMRDCEILFCMPLMLGNSEVIKGLLY